MREEEGFIIGGGIGFYLFEGIGVSVKSNTRTIGGVYGFGHCLYAGELYGRVRQWLSVSARRGAENGDFWLAGKLLLMKLSSKSQSDIFCSVFECFLYPASKFFVFLLLLLLISLPSLLFLLHVVRLSSLHLSSASIVLIPHIQRNDNPQTMPSTDKLKTRDQDAHSAYHYPFWFGGSASCFAASVTHPLDLSML